MLLNLNLTLNTNPASGNIQKYKKPPVKGGFYLQK